MEHSNKTLIYQDDSRGLFLLFLKYHILESRQFSEEHGLWDFNMSGSERT
jgi:hypothetical protein